MHNPHLNLAVDAAREAAKLAKDGQRNRKSLRTVKKGKSWVTNVDSASEELIREILAERYPDYGFLGEESGSVGESARQWVVDPLDGTTNYVHAYPEYCISIALVVSGRPEVGVVYDLNRDDLYTAEHGRGMFLNGRRCKPPHDALLSESLVAMLGGMGSNEWMHKLGPEINRRCDGVRRSGSSALNLAMVAAGFFGGFFGKGMRYWDYAAGALMIRESGRSLIPLEQGGFVFGQTSGFLIGGAHNVAAELRKHALRLKSEEG